MTKRRGGPVVRNDTADDALQFKTWARVFDSGVDWLGVLPAIGVVGPRADGDLAGDLAKRFLAEARRAWMQFGKRWMAERVEAWKRGGRSGFGPYPWALEQFGPPRGASWDDYPWCSEVEFDEARYTAAIAKLDDAEPAPDRNGHTHDDPLAELLASRARGKPS